jgi:hypothetical protein
MLTDLGNVNQNYIQYSTFKWSCTIIINLKTSFLVVWQISVKDYNSGVLTDLAIGTSSNWKHPMKFSPIFLTHLSFNRLNIGFFFTFANI